MRSTGLRRMLRDQLIRDPLVRRYSFTAALTVAVDLITKEVAQQGLGANGVVPISSRLTLMLVWNTGTAGGFSFGPLTANLNVLMTVIAIGLVMAVMRPIAKVDPRAAGPLGLVTGGAIGNLASIAAGPVGVADFIAVRLWNNVTIVANLADFALWFGTLALAPVVLTLIRRVRLERQASELADAIAAPCAPLPYQNPI